MTTAQKTVAQRIAEHLILVLDKHPVTTIEEKRSDIIALNFLQDIASGRQVVVEVPEEDDGE